MNITQSRIGVLMTSTTPLWTGTVVSYTGDAVTNPFRLTCTTVSGSLSTGYAGLAIHAGGEIVRIKVCNTGGVYFDLAENGVSSAVGGGFAAGATVYIYDVRYPFPKFQRIQQNVVAWTTTGGGSGATQFGTWRFTNTGGYTTLYWEIRAWDSRLILYNDVSGNDDAKVARGNTAGTGTISLEAKNGSNISGTVVINDATAGYGTLTITPFLVTKDYDITYTSLGASDNARSKAAQGPISVINPEASYTTLNTNTVFSASGSFATYDGWNGGARDPATIVATDYVWDAGTGGSIISGQNTNTATAAWSTAGFRYLSVTITDSNGTTITRYIPVWVSVSAFAVVSQCNMTWRLGEGWSASLEFKAPPSMLRHSLVAVLDLDTSTILFCGYIWPETFKYDFEKTTMSFTANSALAFLKNCYYYPFRITGVKGDPEDSYSHGWNDFDMLSVPRGVYFLLRWHSNFLEIANAQFDVAAGAPSAIAAENRLEYIRDYTAGTLLDQINVIAQSALYAVYGLRLGGFVVIPNLLYGSTITGVIPETGVNSDTLTEDLLSPNTVAPISYEVGVPTVSDVRASGFYYDVSLNFYPIVVRAPTHPGAFGRPTELTNLIANGPGYTEMIRWAGRHVGLSNNAIRYTIQSLLDVDPLTYKMIDIPDPSNPLAQIRIVVESESLRFNTASLCWEFQLEGRTFGTTADAVVEPPNPTPTVPAVITPIPIPETVDALILHNYLHLVRCLNFSATGDAAVWEDITPAGFDPVNDIICSLSIDPDNLGAWLVTIGTDYTTTGLFRTSDITAGTVSWSLVLSQQDGRDASDAAKTALGFTTVPITTGDFRSCISFGNGSVCVAESYDGGVFFSLDPTCVHVSTNSGASFTTYVPSGGPANLHFFCGAYTDYGCHQLDYQGGTIYMSGYRARSFGINWNVEGSLASSSDGTTWSLAGQDFTNYELYSCNSVGGSAYCFCRNTDGVLLLPNTGYEPATSTYTFGFRRTQALGELVQIQYEGVTLENTGLYLGNVRQLLAGGAVATVSVSNGGTGGTYAPSDVLTLATPEGGTAATVTVLTVSGGQVLTVSLTTAGTGYSVATYATTGGGGTGCTISVLTLTNGVPQFGAARIVDASTFIVAARDAVSSGTAVAYVVSGTVYDRTGNLLTVVGGSWEGTEGITAYPNNGIDASGIEIIQGLAA